MPTRKSCYLPRNEDRRRRVVRIVMNLHVGPDRVAIQERPVLGARLRGMARLKDVAGVLNTLHLVSVLDVNDFTFII